MAPLRVVGRGWFFRINTKPHWEPKFPLLRSEETFLEHDCYLELTAPVEFDDSEIEQALRIPSNYKGRLSRATIERLAAHLPTVQTIPPEQRRVIVAELRTALR